MTLVGRTAAELAAAFRNGETTAEEIAAAHLERANAIQPHLNAYTLIDGEATLARARYLDERHARGHELGPLGGVPVALKDIIDQRGVPTTAGSSFYREVPERSATVVARLEAAGAVILGRTGLHEFAFGFSSENHWWGPVRNPWDTTLSPGGSSGGSAAAVAAGGAPVALGTDTGGSVRVPAALCGVVGLKVTHGRVPVSGVFPLVGTLDTVGPIARTVADAALMYGVIAGDDPADPWSVPRPVEPAGGAADLAGLRIGVPHPWVDLPATTQVREAFQVALDRLADAGAAIIDVDEPLLQPGDFIGDYLGPEVAEVHRAWYDEHPDGYGPETQVRLAAAFATSPDRAAAARQRQAAVRNAAARHLAGVDVLVTPTAGATRKVIGQETIDIDGTAVHYRPVLSRFSALVNHLGGPSLALPLPGTGRPPASLQVIGARWAEARLIAIGLAIEAAGIAGFVEPDGVFS